MTTHPQHPREIRVLGPASGFTVDLRGAIVYTDITGDTVVTMPDTPPAWTPGTSDNVHFHVDGLISYWVDHAPGTPLQMTVTVTAPDGTALLWQHTFQRVPIEIDALGRELIPIPDLGIE